MGKDTKKSTPRRTPVEKEVARQIAIKYQTQRWDWLNGIRPTPPAPTGRAPSAPPEPSLPPASQERETATPPVPVNDPDEYVHTVGAKPKIKGPSEDVAVNITQGRRLLRKFLQEQPDITDDMIRYKLEEAGIAGHKSAIRRMIIEHVVPKRQKRRS